MHRYLRGLAPQAARRLDLRQQRAHERIVVERGRPLVAEATRRHTHDRGGAIVEMRPLRR